MPAANSVKSGSSGWSSRGRLAADRVRRCRPDVPRGTHDPLR
ncbi:hypothetical protein [Micromonospora chersina]